MKNIFILIGPEAPAKISWAVRSESGVISVHGGSLAEVTAYGPGRFVVLVPGIDALVSEAELPPGSRKRALQALPFTMEETLAADVDDTHFAVGGRAIAGKVPVVAVARAKMREWLEMLHEAAIEPDLMVPATLAVPIAADGWTIVAGRDEVLVRQASWLAFACDPENVSPLLALDLSASAQHEAGKKIFLHSCADPLVGLSELAVEVIDAGNNRLQGSEKYLAALAAAFEDSQVINLLQGDFGRHAEWGRVWQKWQRPAALMAAVLVLALLSFFIDSGKLKTESRELSARINSVYLKTFPGAQKVIDPRGQMEQKLAILKGGGTAGKGFVDLVDLCSPMLYEANGFGLQSMRYAEERLDLDFTVINLQVLDELKEKISASGLNVEIKNATSQGGQVQARLQIRGAGQ